MPTANSTLLTVAQAAEKRGVSRWAIHQWLAAGLRSQRLGRMIVIASADLDRYQPRPVGNPGFARARRGRR